MGKLTSASDRTLNLDVRNTELEQSLLNVDRMAHRMQSEKDVALATADREISEAKVSEELTWLHKHLNILGIIWKFFFICSLKSSVVDTYFHLRSVC